MRFAEQWNWCTVEATTDVTPMIREIKLRPDGGQVAPYPVGSHIGVAVLVDGQPQRRCYSLVGDRDPERYRIAVRLGAHRRNPTRPRSASPPNRQTSKSQHTQHTRDPISLHNTPPASSSTEQ